jgi:hypothetical protein
VKQSTDTGNRLVPVITEEVKMSDEQNYIWCRYCERLVLYSSHNTTIIYFKDYPWYSAAQTKCEHCGKDQSLFLTDNLDWELAWAIENDLGFITLVGFPPQEVLDAFDRVYPEYPHIHLLSESEEKEVLFFAWVMEHDPIERWFDGQADQDN